MEFDFNKLISYKNADEAEIGKKYYYFDRIVPTDFDKIEYNPIGILENKDIGKMGSFIIDGCNYAFLYPVEEQHLIYEELKERWIKNPTELYRYKDEHVDIIGMITYFDDGYYTCYLGDYAFTEDAKNTDDTKIIRNITDINGNPLTKEE